MTDFAPMTVIPLQSRTGRRISRQTGAATLAVGLALDAFVDPLAAPQDLDLGAGQPARADIAVFQKGADARQTVARQSK